MAFLLIGGISTFTPMGAPGSTRVVIGGTLLTIWSALFVAGPIITITGVYWKGRVVTSLGIEQVGLMLVTGACLIYDVGLLTASGPARGTFFVACFVTSVAIANIWRFVQTVHRMRLLVAVSRPDTREGGK